MLSELGLTNELVTSTFYKQVIEKNTKDPKGDETENKFKYSNMQVVLLTVSCMYFFLGCTLEYTRKSWYFLAALSLLLGGLKIAVSLFAINDEYLCLDGCKLHYLIRLPTQRHGIAGVVRRTYRADCGLAFSNPDNLHGQPC